MGVLSEPERDGTVSKSMQKLVPATCPWAQNLKKKKLVTKNQINQNMHIQSRHEKYLQCSAIWQVYILIDSILTCPGWTSLVLCN